MLVLREPGVGKQVRDHGDSRGRAAYWPRASCCSTPEAVTSDTAAASMEMRQSPCARVARIHRCVVASVFTTGKMSGDGSSWKFIANANVTPRGR